MVDAPQATGLIFGGVLDGRGGFASQLDDLPTQQPTQALTQPLWLHLERTHAAAQQWLHTESGLTPFVCDLLLEENTRPRLVRVGSDALLVFLRGVNLNPGADMEDMVSLRIYVDRHRLLTLRHRPLKAAVDTREMLLAGKGARSLAELLLDLAENLNQRIDQSLLEVSDQVDELEARADEEAVSFHQCSLALHRRRVAALRRFLGPQRDIFNQLHELGADWFDSTQSKRWNELHNDLTRHVEELDLLRERIGFLQELQQRFMAEKMNRTLYVLGIVTALFLPLGFVTGLLGINVGGMPGAQSPWGFWIALGIMLTLSTVQLLVFRRLRWI
ncbi:zinc transporter ZntB [Atopomonas sediminilitoris]|uniref:zinc transporter ZntB n=1 Tax=Atopomonas sediminilitoris TaxID=2919919 RepID=UPI001F4DBF59|nr:zinc transporter ZntB [Atopomonas sediminilitoris]MCJ8167822.1 zinc transporter ZntB [Atopomonas sediminilitoris]